MTGVDASCSALLLSTDGRKREANPSSRYGRVSYDGTNVHCEPTERRSIAGGERSSVPGYTVNENARHMDAADRALLSDRDSLKGA